MPVSMYLFSIPLFVRGLRALGGVLEKGRADAEARKYAPEILVDARLAPDMHKLSRQVQIASDTVKNGAARLAGLEAPSFPDTESNFEDLQERIAKTIAFLEGVTEASLDGSETRQITLKFPGQEMTFSGAEYLTTFVLPSFYFHLATAYDILRHNGVKIGKRDFLGAS